MKKAFLAGIMAMLLALFFMLPGAMAAGATSVTINGQTLSATNTTTTDGHAVFNAATSTLTLNGAHYENLSYVGDDIHLLYANGDLTINLVGSNSLKVEPDNMFGSENKVYGIRVADGGLTINGSGSLSVTLEHWVPLFGIYVGSYGQSNFTMESGTLSVRCTSTESAVAALTAGLVTMKGGTGSFYAKSTDDFAVAMEFREEWLNYTGGTFTFISDNTNGGTDYYALYYTGELNDPAYHITDGEVHVSQYPDGSDPSLWTSDTQSGRLASNRSGLSTFHYVRFSSTLPEPTPIVTATPALTAEIPQTGDSAAPWLWAGLLLCALLGIAGLAVVRYRAMQ